MKTALKILTLLLTSLIYSSAYSQEVAILNSPNPTEKEVKPAVAANSNEVVITLRNTSEKPVPVFAGPKEGIRNPKIKAIGGLSKNTLYLEVNDVVCLMTNDLKPVACTNIKAGVNSVEINTSATTVTAK
jgi:hypothetical protein